MDKHMITDDTSKKAKNQGCYRYFISQITQDLKVPPISESKSLAIVLQSKRCVDNF